MSESRPSSLQASDTSFRLMVESVQDYGIFMLDPEGHIASWNAGAERIEGYTEEEILGQHFSVFYTAEDRARHYPDYELRVAAREGRFEDEGWRVKKDGTRFWANVVITALFDGSGELVGFGKVTRDLTERVQAESERHALERERLARQRAEELAREVRTQAARLEEQARALDGLNRRLQQVNEQLVRRTEEAERARVEAEAASRAKSEFLANMSHELRTPINAIVGYGDLLQMGVAGPVNEAQKAQLERIRISSEHLLMLVEDILDLSKIEAGRIDIAREVFPLRRPVSAALALLGPQAAERGIEIEDRCAPASGLRLVGDEDRVRQILVNLLSNAVKFTERGGRMTVSCEAVRGRGPGMERRGGELWIRVAVADTGIGIAPELLESVFEPFVQVETGRTRTRGGTGLGLSISRELARLMGGDLRAESEVGRGSTFTLWLPGTAEADG